VQHAQQRGVVQRDLKPSNVLVSADGTPKVTDFGLAKRLDNPRPSPGADQTPSGAILGTPNYGKQVRLTVSAISHWRYS
jgi:serine/threonine-protein kinase